MENQSSTLKIPNGKSLLKAILVAGLIVGTLDGLAAITSSYLTRQVTPDRVFRYVASGVFGKEAADGGIPMAFIGLFFHFIVAYGWTTLFFLVFPKIKFLSWNKFIVGVLYGIFVLLCMNIIVVPLSNVPNFKAGTFNLPQVFIHMFIVGLPISLLANRFYARSKQIA